MNATATVQARIDPASKKEAEKLLGKMGLTMGDAIRLMIRQVIIQQSYPIQILAEKQPNARTLKSMKALERGEGEVMALKDFEKMCK